MESSRKRKDVLKAVGYCNRLLVAWDGKRGIARARVGVSQAIKAGQLADLAVLSGDYMTVTDGPYAETKEQIGGFGVIEAGNLDEAICLMRDHPGLKWGIPDESRCRRSRSAAWR